MNTQPQNIIWLESWETKKEHNVEIGFDNHSMLKGYMVKNVFSDIEQFPKIEFFLELNKLKPKRFDENKVVYGEIICCIADTKYRVCYHYDTNSYIITDDCDTVIKQIQSNS